MSIDFTKIKSLREEINKLLEERPEYRELQDEIDKRLASCGDLSSASYEEKKRIQRNRCAIVQNMMLSKWIEIIPASKELTESVTSMENSLKDKNGKS